MANIFFPDPFHRLFHVSSAPTARMDWLETPSSHILKFDVPGFTREQVKVQVEDGGVLHISGSGRDERSEQKEAAVWHAEERGRQGEFSRRVALPDDARAEGARAAVENGVLTVVVPKEVASKPKTRNIAVASKL